jgi:ubiquinone/menaquinone biosynthesis C-methylase UbiE
MNNEIDPVATAQIKARYNRIARFYDLMEFMCERRFKPWRKKLWKYARGNVLEIGVGTGKNFDYYPPDVKVTGIDLADQMLVQAREHAQLWTFRIIRSILRWPPLSSVQSQIRFEVCAN